MAFKVHVSVPLTTAVACGAASYHATGMYREKITCEQCRRTARFKELPCLPARYRKTKREQRA